MSLGYLLTPLGSTTTREPLAEFIPNWNSEIHGNSEPYLSPLLAAQIVGEIMQKSSRFFCEHCKRETHFVPVHHAVALTGVSRSTVYYWIDKEWIHWRELPSCRKVICGDSLSQSGRKLPKGTAA